LVDRFLTIRGRRIYYHLGCLKQLPVDDPEHRSRRPPRLYQQRKELVQPARGSRGEEPRLERRYRENLEKEDRPPRRRRRFSEPQWVSKKKSLSFREKKMYDRAKYLLVSEVAIVKGIPRPRRRS
jgi:hypothetical protein